MKRIKQIQFHAGSQEELLPDFQADFPYIASRAELDWYVERFVPWHWHKGWNFFILTAEQLNIIFQVEKWCFRLGAVGF